jgi:hypothetical protein
MAPPRRVGIVGSRYPNAHEKWTEEWIERERLRAQVRNKIWLLIIELPLDAVVVSGGAQGVDSWAATLARKRGLEVVEHLPDWDAHGKRAGFLRNSTIVEDSTEIHAYWDGTSKGTESTIGLARKAGKLQTIEVTT